ncbi:hypothetical protein G6O67_008123 [Ophiocordyceps sinensis]|uniref:Uncharacterized protein n=1 Tax=Ophiocordyceps sinensis TaxID=72228 RepID=A0A8H4LTP1_9HYPO|nr:hypothetical protein G6O67_008123 [Ophiocordyceps sinensis]
MINYLHLSKRQPPPERNLHLALFTRSQFMSVDEAERSVEAFHWAFQVSPTAEGAKSDMYHVVNGIKPGDDMRNFHYEKREVNPGTMKTLLGRINLGKVPSTIDNGRIDEILQRIPVPNPQRGGNCVSWAMDATRELQNAQVIGNFDLPRFQEQVLTYGRGRLEAALDFSGEIYDWEHSEIAEYDYSKQQIRRLCEGRKRSPCRLEGNSDDETNPRTGETNPGTGEKLPKTGDEITKVDPVGERPIKLKKVGTVVAGVMNDTLPGWTEIEEHTAKLNRELGAISASPPAADKAALIAKTLRTYYDDVELTVFENYCPGVPEILSNYKKEVAEYKSLKNGLTTGERNLKIAWFVTKGTVSTINDVFRDWIPGVEEGEDGNRKEWTRIYDMANDKSKSFWDVAREVLVSPFKIFGDTINRFARHYGPGVSIAEDLKRDKTRPKGPSEDDNTIPDQPVKPADRKPPPGLSKNNLEQWDLFLGNQLDQDEAAMCVHDKITKENKAGVRHGKGAWKTKLPELTKQCYYELFSQWNAKETDK